MSTNAFYQSYGAMQNALGDPRGDAERRQQQAMQNQMQQRILQMKEAEALAAQQEAQRAAAQRASTSLTAQNAMKFVGGENGYNFGGGQPPQAQQVVPQPIDGPMPLPMQAQAPMPQAPIGAPQMQRMEDGSMREVDLNLVTAQRPQAPQGQQVRGPAPSEDDVAMYQMRDLYQRGVAGDPYAAEQFNTLHTSRRANMTAEEKRGREILGGYAARIIAMPEVERPAAVMNAMEQLGVDPSKTKLDDFIGDPVRLLQELELVKFMGFPEKAGETAIETQGYGERQRLERDFSPQQNVDMGGSNVPFNPATGTYGAGQNKTVDPSVRFTQGEMTRREGMGNATQRWIASLGAASRERVQGMQDRAANLRTQITTNARLSEGEKNRQLDAIDQDLKRAMINMGMPEGSAPIGGDASRRNSGITWDAQ